LKKNLQILIPLLIFCINSIAAIKDSTSIEQEAFDYFIENINSIGYHDGSKFHSFDTSKNKMYFSGYTGFYSALDRSLNIRKKGFVLFNNDKDSINFRRTNIYPIDKLKRSIKSNNKFIVVNNNLDFKQIRNKGDIKVSISNRYLVGQYFYVQVYIKFGVDWVYNAVYIKLDMYGKPIDIVGTYGVY
jgi:hypothetical protein